MNTIAIVILILILVVYNIITYTILTTRSSASTNINNNAIGTITTNSILNTGSTSDRILINSTNSTTIIGTNSVSTSSTSITVLSSGYLQLDIFNPYDSSCIYPSSITHIYTLGYCYATDDGDSYKIYIAKIDTIDTINTIDTTRETEYMTGIETWDNSDCHGQSNEFGSPTQSYWISESDTFYLNNCTVSVFEHGLHVNIIMYDHLPTPKENYIIINRYESYEECYDNINVYTSFMELLTIHCSKGYSFSCSHDNHDSSSTSSSLYIAAYDYNNCTCATTNSQCNTALLETIDNTCSNDTNTSYDIKLFNLGKAISGFYTMTCNYKATNDNRIVLFKNVLILSPSSVLKTSDFGNYASSLDCNNYCETIRGSLSQYMRVITRVSYPDIDDIEIISIDENSLIGIGGSDANSTFTISYQVLATIDQQRNLSSILLSMIACANSNLLNCGADVDIEETIQQKATALNAINLIGIKNRVRTTSSTLDKKTSTSLFIATIILCSIVIVIVIILFFCFIRRRLRRGTALQNMRSYSDSAKSLKLKQSLGNASEESKKADK